MLTAPTLLAARIEARSCEPDKTANFVPDDTSHLKRNVRASLRKHHTDHQLKLSFSSPRNSNYDREHWPCSGQ